MSQMRNRSNIASLQNKSHTKAICSSVSKKDVNRKLLEKLHTCFNLVHNRAKRLKRSGGFSVMCRRFNGFVLKKKRNAHTSLRDSAGCVNAEEGMEKQKNGFKCRNSHILLCTVENVCSLLEFSSSSFLFCLWSS